MDRKEAQLILSGLRPDGVEANEPFFAEALALVETDPELKAWWRAQQEFDRKVAAKLAGVRVPADLRIKILIAPNVIAFPSPWRYRAMLAVAAMVAILCVAATFWQVARYGPLDHTEFAGQALAELDTSGPLLAMTSSDHEQVKQWLLSRNAPVGQMPAKFTGLPSIGCQKYMIHGHAVSLVCFALANGGIAHLFVVSKGALKDPPDPNTMRFERMNGWNVASWSDSKMTYMLVSQSSMDDLKQLLSTG